jgi:ubiquinone/menaquinone biosynthesis C-methylase UbiE
MSLMGTPNIPVQSWSDKKETTKDYLWLNLRDLPYFRALLRAVEARFYEDFELESPILDLGCGDGHFATVAFNYPLDVGLDPWEGPIREAGKRESYSILTQANGSQMPFSDGYFNSVVSNSVLEHITDLDEVLYEVARVLKPGALFLFCVPNHNFSQSLSIGRWLDRYGLSKLGDVYRKFFNRIARHEHLESPVIWEERLERAGFEIAAWWNYYSPAAMRVSEWGHYFGVPSLLSYKLTGRWILIPKRWNLAITYRMLKPFYDEPRDLEDGVCTFYVSRRKSG